MSLNSQLLNGKVAIVTGASRGIGREIALHLGAQGAAVIVNYASNANAAKEVVDAITKAGGRATAVQASIGRDISQGNKLVQAAVDAYGGLDILVNNAGVYLGGAGSEGVTEEQFDEMFAVNSKGPFFLLRAASKVIRNNGRIVNISSASLASGAVSLFGAYAPSKAPLHEYTKLFAAELAGRGVTVNTVMPGFTATDMLSDKILEIAKASSLFKRVGTVEDVAVVVDFLVSPTNNWTTAQSLHVSGGGTLSR
ncbi:3-oxoacyl-(acyl-carrier-protein) reductase [Capsaspora owczarzaki ATCC 30864]|uniref:3-oxoacyl-(Acyl-carrier-protein) reductase n=1 Tax=Capsaspora owczarzaki (strain ATCC 30864) TaxID=595528 RepID=A0A0D2WNZ2_CAPO3|nr:3-oxoacyl-(acyl-carrier-protein) reductase [Capsaspora owczarzaki ATCC 30864]KJE92248.1 3-oxoacyl-(acyl-carrier-protein) reductase [Capsaspora owczarzaki ATCC 30864]|eukprot:XP_004364091.1 3-oxoacyl-(acyl-carrier-protein) reductase [Capsaspora owczarzaki ATCC 30864]